MGVLSRFERRLEGMVEGAFARAFKSELQPVEVASAVQREMDDRAAIVAQGRTLVPNDFVVEIAETDFDRLEVYADQTAPLIDVYEKRGLVRRVDGMASIDEVTAALREALAGR